MAACIDLFHCALEQSLTKLGRTGLKLKEGQYEALKSVVFERKDTICVLPTGYGKSLVYQILPYVFDFFNGGDQSSVIVVSPLNAIIEDQITKLKGNVRVVKGTDNLKSEDLKEPPQILLAHPEVLLENRNMLTNILRSKLYKDRVKAIVVDEAHLIVDWKDFRPCYGKLGLLGSIFPQVPQVALTATATMETKQEITESLGLVDPKFVEVSPDRPNIFFSSRTRPSHGDDKLEIILNPLVEELLIKRQDYPLTLIYGNLATISECYSYFNTRMGSFQYHPIGADPISKNRLFTQFHANYPDHERQRIVHDLVQGVSKLRILFVTVAFGIGVDVPNIRQVIHIGVPHTIEEYFQEAGRCGRDGEPATATIFYNSYDISRGKKSMAASMREYVTTNTKCKREMILNYFGHKLSQSIGPDHLCCDYHQQHCECDDCILVSAAQAFDLHSSKNILPATNSPTSLNSEQRDKIRQELLEFRISLHGRGKTCVGSITLASGFGLELVDMVIARADELTSVDKIKRELPVFDEDHAIAIHNILQKNLYE